MYSLTIHIEGLRQSFYRRAAGLIRIQMEIDRFAVHAVVQLLRPPHLPLGSVFIAQNDPVGAVPIRQCGGQKAQQQDEAQQ